MVDLVPICLEVVFWCSVSAVAQTYVLYPAILLVLAGLKQTSSDLGFMVQKRRRRSFEQPQFLPTVAVLISAYNEEAIIEEKIRNTLQLDYPAEKIDLLVGLDAPTDSTAGNLARMQTPHIRVIHFPERQGKLKVLCTLARLTSAEILVITDANTALDRNCIRNLVRHFADPQVGAASGEEIRLVAAGTDPGEESLYWRYESTLKFLENRLNCSLGGNGSVLAVRRCLFHPVKASIVEDLQIPLEIRYQGYRVVYDPEAVATEEIAPTFAAQFVRRIRLGAGDFQTLFGNLQCLDPRKGLLAFCYLSHRVLRWLAPFFLLFAFLCSAALVGKPAFAVIFGTQVLFYLAALLGFWRKRHEKPSPRFLSLPFQFSLMNLALLIGLVRYLNGRQSLVWASTPRHVQQGVA